MKNESLGEHAYMAFSNNQPQPVETSAVIYQGTDSTGFPTSGKAAKMILSETNGVLCFFCLSLVGQMDFSQVSAPLMTPPISPATLVHRGSVINQGPLTGRPLTSTSSTTCPSSSSSSSCLPSLSPVAQNSPCASFPENLYHCLPQTSSGFFQTSSSSGSNYQPALRSA